ncbi:MAG TPA: hypothetical protein VK809_06080 [Bacteroidia bacterium]|nr:hypothetical protein [Bacteroidia bacterium]
MRIYKILLSFCLLIYLVACIAKKENNSSNSLKQSFHYNKPIKYSSFSIIDTLNKYSEKDSVVIHFKTLEQSWTVDTSSNAKLDEDGNPSEVVVTDTIDASLYLGKLDNVKFGLMHMGSIILLYQKENKKWLKTDSVNFFEDIHIDTMDLNGDEYADIRISTPYDKETGDILTCVFLFENQSKTFKHNYSFSQDNVEYDYANKFVRSWIGCKKEQSGVKWRNVIMDNQLVVDSTITFGIHEDKKTGNKIGIIELYKGQNGAGFTPIKTIDGNPDSLWHIFSKSFWNSSTK